MLERKQELLDQVHFLKDLVSADIYERTENHAINLYSHRNGHWLSHRVQVFTR